MQQRNIGMEIVLTIVTCGIYGIFWYIRMVDDINTLTNDYTTSGGKAFLLSLVTCGIYHLFWLYKSGEKLDNLRTQQGLASGSQAIIYLVLGIFSLSIVSWALIQSELNKYVGGNQGTV